MLRQPCSGWHYKKLHKNSFWDAEIPIDSHKALIASEPKYFLHNQTLDFTLWTKSFLIPSYLYSWGFIHKRFWAFDPKHAPVQKESITHISGWDVFFCCNSSALCKAAGVTSCLSYSLSPVEATRRTCGIGRKKQLIKEQACICLGPLAKHNVVCGGVNLLPLGNAPAGLADSGSRGDRRHTVRSRDFLYPPNGKKKKKVVGFVRNLSGSKHARGSWGLDSSEQVSGLFKLIPCTCTK